MDQDDTSASPVRADVPVAEIEPVPAAGKRKPVVLVAGIAVVIAGAVAGAALAAGGSGSKSGSAIAVLSSAPDRTTNTGTAHVDLTIADNEHGSRFSSTISADVNYTSHRSRLTFGAGTGIEERILDGDVYVEAPQLSLPDGAHWVEITPDDVKLNSKELQGLAGNNVSSGLQGLKAIVGTPVNTGESSLDGVNVAHYSFTMNLKQAMSSTADAASQLGFGALKQLIDQGSFSSNFSRVPADAWVDDNGRVRKMQMTLSFTSAGDSATVLDTLHFTNFGEPVDVTEPATSDAVLFSQYPDVFSTLNPGSS